MKSYYEFEVWFNKTYHGTLDSNFRAGFREAWINGFECGEKAGFEAGKDFDKTVEVIN